MLVPKSVIWSLPLLLLSAGKAQATPFADIVNFFAGGSDFGVLDGSGGTYTGASGPGCSILWPSPHSMGRCLA